MLWHGCCVEAVTLPISHNVSVAVTACKCHFVDLWFVMHKSANFDTSNQITEADTNTEGPTHTRTHTHIYRQTHACTHRDTHTHTQTHTHTEGLSFNRLMGCLENFLGFCLELYMYCHFRIITIIQCMHGSRHNFSDQCSLLVSIRSVYEWAFFIASWLL